MKAFASLLSIAWLAPHEIAMIWQGGAAGVELRVLAGAARLEPGDHPSDLRLELLWRF